MAEIRIGLLAIGPEHPCACIAELSNAANGKFENAIKLLDAAKAAGASAAKLQCYSVEELVSLRGDGPAPAPWNDRSMRDLYTQAMTPHEWFDPLYKHAARIGLPIFSSVFGSESLALLEAVGNTCYKISHFECRKPDLLRMVKATGKPMIVSVPSAWRLDVPPGDLTVHCPGGYPAEPADLHLFSGMLGLSSHCLEPEVAPMAVAFGAKYLEYHFMLAEEPSELESNVSYTQYQFRDMVKSVRMAEVLCG